MSVGLSLIKKLCAQGSRAAFRQVRPEHFIAEEQPVYAFVRDYYRSYGQLPAAEALLDNGFNLHGIRDNEAAGYYIDRMSQRHVLLQAREVIGNLQQAVIQGYTEQVVEIVQNLNAVIRQQQTGGSVLSLAEAIDAVVDRYEEARTRPGIQGVTFGYSWLDEITGGVQPGDVVSLAARTNMGKSYFLNHFAMHAWMEGNSVLYVSNEMTAVQMTTRFIGQYTGISPDLIRRGQLSNFVRERFYNEAVAMQSGAPFTIVDGSFRLGIGDVDNLIQEFNPDVVYVDAAYLLIPEETRFSAKGWELQREMSKGIKRIAMARNKGIVQTLQLNRDGVKKTGEDMDVGMVSGGDGFAQDATTMLLLGPGASPNEETTRDLVVGKNREGRKSWMRSHFLFDPMNFDYITCKEDAGSTDALAGGAFNP